MASFQKVQIVLLAIYYVFSMTNSAAEETSLYDFQVTSLDGSPVDLGIYRGKVALVVNTASKCGFTSQYAGLEKLYERYRERGFVVLGFPSNDFLGQEPGSNEEIAHFCKINYGVSFPLFSKAPVSGAEKQPIYRFLTEQSAKEFQGDPGWNFVKFVVNSAGHVVGRFSSMTKPESKKVVSLLERLLPTDSSSPGPVD